MNGIFGSLGNIFSGQTASPSEQQKSQAVMDYANALYDRYRNCGPALAVNSIALGHRNTIIGPLSDNMQWRPPPGIRWFQKTNRRWLVEIVR